MSRSYQEFFFIGRFMKQLCLFLRFFIVEHKFLRPKFFEEEKDIIRRIRRRFLYFAWRTIVYWTVWDFLDCFSNLVKRDIDTGWPKNSIYEYNIEIYDIKCSALGVKRTFLPKLFPKVWFGSNKTSTTVVCL